MATHKAFKAFDVRVGCRLSIELVAHKTDRQPHVVTTNNMTSTKTRTGHLVHGSPCVQFWDHPGMPTTTNLPALNIHRQGATHPNFTNTNQELILAAKELHPNSPIHHFLCKASQIKHDELIPVQIKPEKSRQTKNTQE